MGDKPANEVTKESLKRLTRFLWEFMRQQKGRFLLIFLLSTFWSLDQTIWPYIMGKIVDTLSFYDLDREGAWSILKWQLIGGGLFWIVLDCGYRLRDFLQAKAFPELEAVIRMAMFDHIQQHSPRYFNEHFAGTLANKITDMTTQIRIVLLDMLLFFPALVTCLLTMILFHHINPHYMWIIAVWLMIHFAISAIFAPKCVKYSHLHGESRSSLAGKIVDSLTNNFTVNLFTAFKAEKARITESQSIEKQRNYKALYYMAIMLLLQSLIDLLGGFLINGFTFYSWMHGQVSTGTIIQIFSTTLNMMFIIWFSGALIPQFFQAVGILNQAYSLMLDPKDISDTPNASPIHLKKGDISFQNVTFGYGEGLLFKNMNIHIASGEKIGLVGYSGGGKSTFVKLIMRFYPLRKGAIIIDNQDISLVTLESLRKQVSLIPQDPLLFHRTLEENILYGRPSATHEEVIQAAIQAHCHEFILKAPQGYATLVGERGTKLSGGERQRIAIARAILANTPILILDEATSSLDSVTEKYIQESIKGLMEHRTTIVIAHRLSTLNKMDRIIVFHMGNIIEEGSHEDLLTKNGHYAHMWHMQAGGFLPVNPFS